MRIRVVHKLGIASIEGIRLDDFEPGQSYDVGSTVGAFLLAEGWAVPDDPADFGSSDPPTQPEMRGVHEHARALRDIAADYSRRSPKK